jgi:uncharacterized protein YdhG (YjbR/CyaY superfamily)
MSAPPTEIQAYLARQPAPQRKALRKLRKMILAALPGATERISYKIPAFERDGRVLLSMAGFKSHCSLFGGHATARIAKDEPGEGFRVKGSTIQFDPAKGLPAMLVRKIAKVRVAEEKERAEARRNNRQKALAKKATKKR